MSTCKSSFNTTAFALQDDYRSGILTVPDWQRDSGSWEKDKRDFFDKTVINKTKMPEPEVLAGTVVTYKIKGDTKSHVKINDGRQRISAFCEIYDKLRNEVDGSETHKNNYAKTQLSNIIIVNQFMIYEDEDEARTEFIYLNKGTELSGKEKANVILSKLPLYKEWKARIFERVTEIVKTSIKSIAGVKYQSTNRGKIHSLDRKALSLFLRYCSKDTESSCYKLKLDDTDYNYQIQTSLLESRVLFYFKNKSLHDIEDELKNFRKFIDENASHILHIWSQINKSTWKVQNQQPTEQVLVGLLNLSIFRSLRHEPLELFDKFVKLMFEKGHGTTQIVMNDDKVAQTSFEISSFINLQEGLSCNFTNYTNPSLKRKKLSTKRTKPGTALSHIRPFSKHGNGPVVIQDAVSNLSNGAKELTILDNQA